LPSGLLPIDAICLVALLAAMFCPVGWCSVLSVRLRFRFACHPAFGREVNACLFTIIYDMPVLTVSDYVPDFIPKHLFFVAHLAWL
jgi:hypothetical protein